MVFNGSNDSYAPYLLWRDSFLKWPYFKIGINFLILASKQISVFSKIQTNPLILKQRLNPPTAPTGQNILTFQIGPLSEGLKVSN